MKPWRGEEVGLELGRRRERLRASTSLGETVRGMTHHRTVRAVFTAAVLSTVLLGCGGSDEKAAENLSSTPSSSSVQTAEPSPVQAALEELEVLDQDLAAIDEALAEVSSTTIAGGE